MIKRNIDHIIELWESGKSADEIREFMYEKRLSTLVEKVDIQKWLSPYVEPSRHPKLTPDEIKAVKWLVDGGFETLERTDSIKDMRVFAQKGKSWMHVLYSPKTEILDKADWIDMFAINLKELLDAQEEPSPYMVDLKRWTKSIKLTAEERKALELAKMCGFTSVYRVEFITAHTGVVFVVETPGKSFECLVSNVPAWSFLQDAKWITTDDRLSIDDLLKGGAE